MDDRSDDAVFDKCNLGFDYVLRDKLKQHCREKNLFLHCDGMNMEHDLLINLITYSSMGDWNQALKSAEETNKFLTTSPLLVNNTWWWIQEKNSKLILEVWRNCFIRTKLAIEYTGLGPTNYDYHTIPQTFARRVKNFVGSPEALKLYLYNKTEEWKMNSFSAHNYIINNMKT